MFRLVGISVIALFLFACSESESSADALKEYFENLSFADSENESSSSFSGLSPDSVVTGEFKDAHNSNCEKYGRLYSWMTAIGKSDEECGYQKACSLTYPVQGICPEGWHIPSKAELATLVENAGGPSIAGARLKAKEGWEPAWNECTGTDDYHFSAMASGYLRVYTDHYYNKGYHTGIWSSTEVEDFHRAEQYQHIDVYILFLDYDKDTAQVSDTNRDFAESVRCLKDDSEK